MIKKILIILGVSAFSVFWWVGFQKVRENAVTQAQEDCEAVGFTGRQG